MIPLLGWASDGRPDPGEDGSVRVEPGVEIVPANHLKFYLHFPEPMERGVVFRHLRLVEIDGDGKVVAEVPEPFREVELWDETFQRMTLWFHPGRQKPGVNLNVDIGPILEEGNRYRLEVSPDWKTESGAELKGELAHAFAAGPYDEVQPDPSRWKIEGAKSTGVTVVPDGPLDPESVKKRVRIVGPGGRNLEYTTDFSGKRIRMTGSALTPGRYRLVVDPRLEDLAGNSIARPFNLDLEADRDFEERTEPIEIPFEIPE
ncbi:MAG: Ig-like domain-containing protein [Verrucomicrobiales bacterium]